MRSPSATRMSERTTGDKVNMQTVAVNGSSYLAADYASVLGTVHRSLPYSLRVLAENVYRQDPSGESTHLVAGRAGGAAPMRPARLILQDMLGLPLLVDLMAVRAIAAEAGGYPARIDMSLPVDLIIDHAMTIEHWAEEDALTSNSRARLRDNASASAQCSMVMAWSMIRSTGRLMSIRAG